MALAIRNMLVLEQGGRGGLDENERDLHLFSVVSPVWAEPGRAVGFRNARTEMGTVSATMHFRDGGADVAVESDFHHPPRYLIIHVPYYVELEGFESDDPAARREGDSIVLGPGAKRLSFSWRPKQGAHDGTFQKLIENLRAEPSVEIVDGGIEYVPAPEAPLTADEAARGPEPLSFRLVLDVFRHETARRFDEFARAGGKVVTVAAPSLLTAAERRKQYEEATK